jgi:hypothetical protein
MSGIQRIADERNRQANEEGHTPGHDDRHDPAVAAAPTQWVTEDRKTSRLSSKSPPTIDELIKEVMNDADGPVPNSELSDERLYSRLVGAALVHGTPMTRDAKTFYASRAGGVYE